MKAAHLNCNINYDAVSSQNGESFTVHRLLVEETSVFILQHGFGGSSHFVKGLQT